MSTIANYCPRCRVTLVADRLPQDPPRAVVVRVCCDGCGGGPAPVYLDRQDHEVPAVPGLQVG